MTKPNDPYYGAWREAEDLILFKIPGHEEFRLSNKAAERLYEDFAKICGQQDGADTKRLDWLEAHPLEAEVKGGPDDGGKSKVWIMTGQWGLTLREALDAAAKVMP